MDILMIIAWVMFVIMIVSGVAILVFLGGLPGRVAKRRGHPYADAIAIGGWVTLLTGAVLWPLVLIWAYMAPAEVSQP